MEEPIDPKEWSNEEVEKKLRAKGLPVFPVGPDTSCGAESLNDLHDRGVDLDFGELIDNEVNHPSVLAWENAAAAFSLAIGHIIKAKNPALMSAQIAWACGMCANKGQGLAEISKRFGISKQAFQKGAMKIAAELSIKPTRAMKFEASRKKYSQANYRNTKP